MAADASPPENSATRPADGAALQQIPWRRLQRLSSVPRAAEDFLARAGFDRAPWLAVAFAAGIGSWYVLPTSAHWLALILGCCGLAMAASAILREEGRFPWLRQALSLLLLMLAAGCAVVWTKSAIVGAEPIARPVVASIEGRILDREDRPAEQRVRLVLTTREPETGRAIRVRINVPQEAAGPRLIDGAHVRLRARLMPPAPPMLPGAYDFARTAWFQGLAATGSVLGPIAVVEAGSSRGLLGDAQAALSEHVRESLPGRAGGIAVALASGERGAIAEPDAQAMRDAGLAHLISISGLHVSALVGAAYLIAIRLLALWPWLALRVRLPLVASGIGAAAGVAYTLLSGSEVPTVRSCIGALLVLAALALGREALSLRVLAIAALFVMLLWPESVIGPSFQMSFAAVIAIVALSGAAPVRRFLSPREEGMAMRGLRYMAALLLTGVVIELALLPIGLWHFHRSGVYGSLANLVAIPITTVLTMPLIALALLLDLAGLGAPAWWLAGKTIEVMLALAHFVAAQPGSVTTSPAMSGLTMALFVAGGLWLALWTGRVRMWGFVPIAFALLGLAQLRAPDILVSGDGRHVGIVSEGAGKLIVLREGRSSFATDNLTELAGVTGGVLPLDRWDGAQCSAEFCTVEIYTDGRHWTLLVARGRERVPERSLAAACERVDIVIADRWLPRSCRPRWLKADRKTLAQTGGLAIDLDRRAVETVAQHQGRHGWWRPPAREIGRAPAAPSGSAVGIQMGKSNDVERDQARPTIDATPPPTHADR